MLAKSLQQRDMTIESEKLRALVFAIHKQHYLELVSYTPFYCNLQLLYTLFYCHL
jgi:hypothetical protein